MVQSQKMFGGFIIFRLKQRNYSLQDSSGAWLFKLYVFGTVYRKREKKKNIAKVQFSSYTTYKAPYYLLLHFYGSDIVLQMLFVFFEVYIIYYVCTMYIYSYAIKSTLPPRVAFLMSMNTQPMFLFLIILTYICRFESLTVV